MDENRTKMESRNLRKGGEEVLSYSRWGSSGGIRGHRLSTRVGNTIYA